LPLALTLTLRRLAFPWFATQGSQRGELSDNDKAIRAWLAKRDAALKR